jgi:uncharacterized membrane protein YtjA (UPF0391 family)
VAHGSGGLGAGSSRLAPQIGAPRQARTRNLKPFFKEIKMLYWAAVFFIIALIAAVLGFGGIAAGAAVIAKILFFIFLIAFVVSLLLGVLRRAP